MDCDSCYHTCTFCVDPDFQERTGQVSYDHENVTLKYKLDNEFELVYVVAYQRILQLSYVDKFLSDIHLEFRDAFKNKLQLQQYGEKFDFSDTFNNLLKDAEEWGRKQAAAPKAMKSFEESQKSKKTVASMIERKGDDKENKKVKKVESRFLFLSSYLMVELEDQCVFFSL